MKELQEMTVAIIGEMTESGKIETLVTNAVENCVESIISKQFQTHSDFGKSIEAAIKEKFSINLDGLKIADYNQQVIHAISASIDTFVKQTGLEKVRTDVAAMLGEKVPSEVKLSDLVEMFKIDTRKLSEELNDNEISFHYRHSHGFDHIEFDPDSGKREFQCAYKLTVKDGKITEATVGQYTSKQVHSLHLGRFYGFDKYIFQLYTTGATVILDYENVTTEVDLGDDDDY